jgi:hypothetical protein
MRAVERLSTIQLQKKKLLGGSKYTVLPLYMVVGTWLNYTVLTQPLRLTSCTSQKKKCNFLFFEVLEVVSLWFETSSDSIATSSYACSSKGSGFKVVS